jgi:hypothetical protein
MEVEASDSALVVWLFPMRTIVTLRAMQKLHRLRRRTTLDLSLPRPR